MKPLLFKVRSVAKREEIDYLSNKRVAILTIVMPTHNRSDVLGRVLRTLESQIAEQRASVEVIVCDDGSADATSEVLALPWSMPMLSMRLAHNSGPAKARNTALAHARGQVVLFLGDDIEPGPGMIAAHIAWHRAHPDRRDALLGHTTWPANMKTTPFMQFLEQGGRALFFDYQDLPRNRPVSGAKFYTCNVSLKRALYEEVGGFDESFPFASHEDLEYGLRLEQAGMRLWYDPSVLGLHWHQLDLAGTIRRLYRMGFSSVLFWQRVRRPGKWRRQFLRRGLATVFALVPVRSLIRRMLDRAELKPSLWWLAMQGAYWVGVADGYREVLDQEFLAFTAERSAPARSAE